MYIVNKRRDNILHISTIRIMNILSEFSKRKNYGINRKIMLNMTLIDFPLEKK